MDIHNTTELKACARRRLADAGQAQRIAAIFAGLALGMTALVTLVGQLLNLQISRSSGLSGMDTRTTLTAVQSLLPIISALVTMCLELGYQAAMLRVARGQYASPQTLRLGFDRFWVLLRCVAIQALILFGIIFAAIYLSVMIFMFTPFANRVVELLAPLMQNASVLNPEIVLDDATYAQLMQAMLPVFLICGVVVCLLAIPLMFRFRMARFVIIDRPGTGAMAALRESRRMMKGNCLRLFRLDVSLWWYYAAMVAAELVCYGDILLPMAGVNPPWSDTVSHYLFFAAYLAVQFAVYYFLRNPAETSYAIAYDAIRPKESQDGGMVLGNIFQQ